ncbi:hypothetical protein L1887_15560 [Cichorium endivia]|nr:hypothetical protein L1887_15560 [Cichorium endivia]
MDATTGLDMIEAIRFKHSSVDQLQRYKHLPPIVANTKNLRLIEWDGDLASALLTNFPQRKLCCLILHNSSQKQLWQGYKILPNLKIMELRRCRKLFKLLEIQQNMDNLHLENSGDADVGLQAFCNLQELCLKRLHAPGKCY